MGRIPRGFSGLILKSLFLAMVSQTPGLAAESTVPQLDIVGLKLGMTVEEAKAALMKFNPRIITRNEYLLDSGAWSNPEDVSNGVDEFTKKEFEIAKVKLLVTVRAAAIDHLYDYHNVELPNTSDSKAYLLGGEWFSLEFTPNDDGGRLYFIGRASRTIKLEGTKESISQKIVAKFGEPSNPKAVANGRDMIWLYDIRGRQLGENSREYQRCATDINVDKGDPERFKPQKTYNKKYKVMALVPANKYHEVLENKGFTKEAPEVPWNYADGKNTGLKQCGTLLVASVSESLGAVYFMLTDVNASGYDTGVFSYLTKKVKEANASSGKNGPDI